MEYDVFLAHNQKDIEDVTQLYDNLIHKNPDLKIYFSKNDAKHYESVTQFVEHVEKCKLFCCCFKETMSDYLKKEIERACELEMNGFRVLLPGGDEKKYKVSTFNPHWTKMDRQFNVDILYSQIDEAINLFDKNEATSSSEDQSNIKPINGEGSDNQRIEAPTVRKQDTQKDEGEKPEEAPTKISKKKYTPTILLSLLLITILSFGLFYYYHRTQELMLLSTIYDLKHKNNLLNTEKNQLNKKALSRQLAFSALQQMQHNKEKAIATAIKACQHEPTFEAHDILLSILVQPHTDVVFCKKVHNDAVLSIAVSENQAFFATGSSDGTIKLWNMYKNVPIHQKSISNGKQHQKMPVSALIFRYGLDNSLISGDIKGCLRSFSKTNGFRPIRINENKGKKSEIFFLQMSTSDQLIVGYRHQIEIYKRRLENFILDKTITEKSQFRAIAVNKNIIIAGLKNRDIKQWDLDQLTQVSIIRNLGKVIGNHNGIRDLIFDKNRNAVISSGFNRQLCKWDIGDNRPVSEKNACKYIPKDIFSMAFTSDGRHLISGNIDNTTSIWMPDELQLLIQSATQDHHNYVSAIAVLDQMSISGDYDGKLMIWKSIPRPPIHLHSIIHPSVVRCLVFHPSQSIIVTGDENGKIQFTAFEFDNDTIKCKKTTKVVESSGAIKEMSFSLKGDRLIYSNDKNEMGIYEPQTNTHTRITGRGKLFSVGFYPDNNTNIFVSIDNNILYKHEIQIDGKIVEKPIHLAEKHDTPVRNIAINTDFSIIATGSSDCQLIVQSLSSQNHLQPYKHKFNSDIYCMAFSKDNNRLAIGDAYGNIHVLNIQKRILNELTGGHNLSVNSLAFSPKDPHILVSASFDKQIIIWDLNQHKALGKTIREHVSHIEDIAFHPQGQFLASSGGDKYLHFWEFGQKNWVKRAKKIHSNKDQAQ